MKGSDAPDQWRKLARADVATIQNPVLQIGIGEGHQALELRKLRLVSRREPRLGVAAQQPVHLLRAAMGGTIERATAARLEIVHQCAAPGAVADLDRSPPAVIHEWGGAAVLRRDIAFAVGHVSQSRLRSMFHAPV